MLARPNTVHLTIAAASDLLGIDPKTLSRWTKAGVIHQFRPFEWSKPSYERKVVEQLAKSLGITLDRNPHYPAHYTPPTLAEAVGHGMTATRIRSMIQRGEIKTIRLPKNKHRQSMLIDQAEGLRAIRRLTQPRMVG